MLSDETAEKVTKLHLKQIIWSDSDPELKAILTACENSPSLVEYKTVKN